ncbi:anti-sigma factor [Cobetia sp. ICG0124]|uniref:anti-sigma factor n=1 Tax=Cobetia sp. ICG0124 TaxID=2053669 RepID=UPI000FDA45C5|nr:anti-sigma factor [Cobetia sp. ICG0124]AZV31718.1 anti-sigma factor [Cobetia sp. ICG0124]
MNHSPIPESPQEQNLLLGEHTLGLLDPEREAEVRAWIERDDEAARMALRWQQHWLSVSDRLPPEPASDSLWKRIDASLTRLKQTPTPANDTPPVANEVPESSAQRMVAVLQTLEDPATPTWVASVTAGGGLQLTPNVTIERPTDRAIELWTLTDPAEGPRSLGLVDPVAGIELSAEQIGRMSPGQLLEMTLEPSGGSPTGKPTGKVLAIGRLVNLGQIDS